MVNLRVHKTINTMIKQLATTFLALISTIIITRADIPAGYYSGLNGKNSSELKTALRNIIHDHTQVSSYSDLPKYFMHTDVRPSGNEWWEMYSNNTFSYPSFSGMNREHSLPKSWWGGASNTPAYTDLNHLYPSEKNANSAKSNYPLGEVQTATFDNGVSKVGYAVTGQGGGAAKVFEPADEYKGDFARTYFYMATCYQDLTWKYSYMMQNGAYPSLTGWAIDLLLKWHRNDPVSQKEIDRNDVVYSYQNNRNPFIDIPSLAEYIWGDKTNELFYADLEETPSGIPNLITPTQGTSLDFGEIAIGQSKTMNLLFKGENLSGTMTLVLSSGDKTMFNLSDSEIKTSLINTSDGYWFSITYTPSAIGEHSAKLIVYDGGLDGSRGIVLSGKCLEAPTLSAVKALNASSITQSSYTANWEATTETIDYYIVTRTRYINGNASIEEIEAEDNSLEITDFDGSDSESYTVQSVRLGYRSPESNVIFVEHAGISGVKTDSPLAAISYPGWIRFICSEQHYNGTVYDISGKVIMRIPMIYNNMEISLPHGLYFLTTDQQHKPLRIPIK